MMDWLNSIRVHASPSRETDRRECSPAPVDEHGLTELRSGAPTLQWSGQMSGSGVAESLAPALSESGDGGVAPTRQNRASDHPTAEQCYTHPLSSRICERGTKSCIVGHSKLAAEPALSAEPPKLDGEIIEVTRTELLAYTHFSPERINRLCDMALRSLTAQVKCCCGKPTELGIVHREKEPCFHFSEAEILTARDEGIEAAAKVCQQHSYDWNPVDLVRAETAMDCCHAVLALKEGK